MNDTSSTRKSRPVGPQVDILRPRCPGRSGPRRHRSGRRPRSVPPGSAPRRRPGARRRCPVKVRNMSMTSAGSLWSSPRFRTTPGPGLVAHQAAVALVGLDDQQGRPCRPAGRAPRRCRGALRPAGRPAGRRSAGRAPSPHACRMVKTMAVTVDLPLVPRDGDGPVVGHVTGQQFGAVQDGNAGSRGRARCPAPGPRPRC